MITETRQSRLHLLHTYERRARRRHHTLDNATLDKFNFVCVPLHPDETTTNASSQSNLISTSSNEYTIPKSIGLPSPTRRVRFKFDENQQAQSAEEIREPKRFSVHRVECQIPIHRTVNSSVTTASSSSPAKTRSITSQKIDIIYPNSHPIYLQSMTSIKNSPTVRKHSSHLTKRMFYRKISLD